MLLQKKIDRCGLLLDQTVGLDHFSAVRGDCIGSDDDVNIETGETGCEGGFGFGFHRLITRTGENDGPVRAPFQSDRRLRPVWLL
jgi:hypothetical protein